MQDIRILGCRRKKDCNRNDNMVPVHKKRWEVSGICMKIIRFLWVCVKKLLSEHNKANTSFKNIQTLEFDCKQRIKYPEYINQNLTTNELDYPAQKCKHNGKNWGQHKLSRSPHISIRYDKLISCQVYSLIYVKLK